MTTSLSRVLLASITVSFFSLVHPGQPQAKPYEAAGSPLVMDADTRERLMSDARHAWSYFERVTGRFAGMPSINIWRQGASYGSYDIATMWDTGSIILATISARSIGIIDDREFERRIGSIMKFLDRATTTYKGAKLPNFRSNSNNGRSIEAGYDATDTGRLFVALHVLDRATGGKYKAEALMKKWNISATVSDGALQDIKGGKLKPAQSNIYRYYVSHGYRLWDIPHAPVYSGASPDSSEAARARFIEELSSIGPISSEPSLNEIVELGGSPYGRVIAETLNAAQKKRYADTGKLTAVSEGPIDEEPWFTYQGYDLSRGNEKAWTVYPWITDPKWATPEFAEKFRLVSAKAAFLWFAAYPSEYTRELWMAVREKARAEKFGYHAGIYETSGKVPKSIDVNSNATILSAIAYLLNDQQPLTQLKISRQ
ncbi:hypothetical protein W911_04515 [Hyphomicrobium nitrativorans NL23]|uniref:DUF3131 domain-containing protein n=1 Tax=Hyphomicrobium nitrativorans NL23 TaxID=1029756 RepID=V5SJ23_9HYPH|nr:DUF3131 domain-containing protein [Hyphomicrobium nitrativorans]AHB49944.1 hypothetical protein W911_04515 [Hyphomicrobium nitrativorans NL23]